MNKCSAIKQLVQLSFSGHASLLRKALLALLLLGGRHIPLASLEAAGLSEALFGGMDPGAELLTACNNNSSQQVAQLLQDHPNLLFELHSKSGKSPLHLAAELYYPQVAQVLLAHIKSHKGKSQEDKLALLRKPNAIGLSPIHTASSCWSYETLRLLLAADPQSVDLPNREGEYPLQLACKNKRADIRTPFNFSHMLGLFLEYKANTTIKDSHGNTLFHLASERDHTEALRELIEQVPETGWLSAVNNDKETPLHLACRHNHTRATALLLQQEAPIDLPNREGDTPVHLACKQGNTQLLTTLLESLDKEQRQAVLSRPNQQGNTPLKVASSADQAAIVALLLTYGADPNASAPNAQEQQAYTPLQLACKQSATQSALELIKHSTTDIYALSPFGYTPLHMASYYHLSEVVEALLARGKQEGKLKAMLNQPSLEFADTPLHLASLVDDKQVAALLIGEEAIDMNLCNQNKLTPLELGAFHDALDVLTYCLEERRLLQTADLEVTAPELKQKLLHSACRGGAHRVVHWLIDQHQAPLGLSSSGFTPLHLACMKEGEGNQAVIAKLLTCEEIDPGAITQQGETALHWACHNRYYEHALRLMEDSRVKKALKQRNAEGKTVHDLLLEQQQASTAQGPGDPLSRLFKEVTRAMNFRLEETLNQEANSGSLARAKAFFGGLFTKKRPPRQASLSSSKTYSVSYAGSSFYRTPSEAERLRIPCLEADTLASEVEEATLSPEPSRHMLTPPGKPANASKDNEDQEIWASPKGHEPTLPLKQGSPKAISPPSSLHHEPPWYTPRSSLLDSHLEEKGSSSELVPQASLCTTTTEKPQEVLNSPLGQEKPHRHGLDSTPKPPAAPGSWAHPGRALLKGSLVIALALLVYLLVSQEESQPAEQEQKAKAPEEGAEEVEEDQPLPITPEQLEA